MAAVVVGDPFHQELVTQTSAQMGVTKSCRAVALKEEKYVGWPSSDLFLPFAVEVFSHLRPQFAGVLQQAAWDLHARSGAPLSVLTDHFCQRISVTLQQVQALAVHGCFLAVGSGIHLPRQVLLEELHIALTDGSSILDVQS